MFIDMTLRQQRDLVRIVVCRADAWLDWEDHPVDVPLRSVRQIFHSIGGLFRRGGQLAPPRTGPLAPEAPPPAAPVEPERAPSRVLPAFGIRPGALAITRPPPP